LQTNYKLRKLEIDEECIFDNIIINLLPQCTKCGSPVTDSIESEIKSGNYIKVLDIQRLSRDKKERRKQVKVTITIAMIINAIT
jgi:hypothetical protein